MYFINKNRKFVLFELTKQPKTEKEMLNFVLIFAKL